MGITFRIVIDGEFEALLAEIAAYKTAQTPPSRIRAPALLVNEQGQPLSAAMLRNRFDDARDAAGINKAFFQFRDLRAKAATETDEASGTRSAQALPGHTTQTLTSSCIRHKVGKKVRLLK